MMKLNGKISIRIDRKETTIDIKDDNANTTFVRVTLTPEQLSAALSGMLSVECKLEVSGLERVGKTHENKTFEFEIPEEMYGKRNESELHKLAQSQLLDGWVADSYFGRQDSLFKKDGKQYARCTIRRWT